MISKPGIWMQIQFIFQELRLFAPLIVFLIIFWKIPYKDMYNEDGNYQGFDFWDYGGGW